MIKMAPELFSPVVHTYWKDDPARHISYEKSLVRQRIIAAKWKPADYAFNYIRTHLREGGSLEHLIDRIGVTTNCYVTISIGTFMGAPAGKVKVEMWDGQSGSFSIRNLADKYEREKKQNTLF